MAQLIEALAERLEGDRKAAGVAVESIVDVIVRTVNKGEKVNITGFGVFEKRARAARTARNPRTGESVKVKKTNVPAFRAGTTFREVVGGSRKLPKVSVARTASSARPSATAPTRPPTARGTTTRATTAVKATARPTTGAAKTAATKLAQKPAKATAPKKETTTPKKTAPVQAGKAKASKKK
jgi:DNA-binding protein HU-beta